MDNPVMTVLKSIPNIDDAMAAFGKVPYRKDFWDKVKAVINEEYARYDREEKALTVTYKELHKMFDL